MLHGEILSPASFSGERVSKAHLRLQTCGENVFKILAVRRQHRDGATPDLRLPSQPQSAASVLAASSLCMLRMAVTRSSSGGVVNRYVLPAL